MVADKCFRQIGEQGHHLRAALEPVLRRKLAAVAVGDDPAVGDTKQRVVCFIILAFGEERLVGGDQWDAAAVGEFDQRRFGGALGGHAVALQFDIEPVAEQPLQRFAA